MDNQGRIEIVLKDPDQIVVIEPGKPITSVPGDHISLRLEARMTCIEAELRDLKQHVVYSGRSGTAESARSDSTEHMLQIELNNLQQQQVYNLNRTVKDLEDMIVHLAQRCGR